MSTATNLINDGNSNRTQIIEATVAGDTVSAVQLFNNGVFILGNTNHHGSISLDNATIVSDGSGNLTVSRLSTSSITSTLDFNGTTTLGAGTLTSFSTFTYTASSGTDIVNHFFNGTPVGIILILKTQSGSNVIDTPFISNVGATTFHANSTIAISGNVYWGIAIG